MGQQGGRMRSARYFVILAAMRTGSNLLQSNLNQYRDILCLGELFNRNFVGHNVPGKPRKVFAGYSRQDVERRDENPMLFFDRIHEEAGERILGFRMFRRHSPELLEVILKNRNCSKIVLRRNPLDSFVSLRIANKTKKWMAGKPDRVLDEKVQFSMARFLDYLKQNEAFYSLCETVMRDSGQEYFDIRYEQVKDIAVLNRLAAFVGSRHEKDRIKEKIFKQTRPGLREKVENYDEMIRSLKEEGLYERFMES